MDSTARHAKQFQEVTGNLKGLLRECLRTCTNTKENGACSGKNTRRIHVARLKCRLFEDSNKPLHTGAVCSTLDRSGILFKGRCKRL